MKGTNLGEFEELVMLTIASLDNKAYSVAICDEIEKNTGRKVKLGMVHASLNRLEKKGYVHSHLGEATKMRGGRRKRLFNVTQIGVRILHQAKEQRNRMWDLIPDFVLEGALS